MIVYSAVLAALVLMPQAPTPSHTQAATSSSVAPQDARAERAPAEEAAPDASVGSIIRHLPGDFLRLGSPSNLMVLGATGAAALAVHGHDARISLNAFHSATFDRFGEGGGTVGGAYVQVGAAAALFVAGHVAHRSHLAQVGADLLEAQAVNGVLTQTIKLAVDRERPNGGRYSFPSGHTSATFATAAVIERDFGWRAGLPLYAVGAYVAGSRVQQQKHYLSDVIFGAGVGIASGHAIQIRAAHRRFMVTPVAVPGGAGIWVVQVR